MGGNAKKQASKAKTAPSVKQRTLLDMFSKPSSPAAVNDDERASTSTDTNDDPTDTCPSNPKASPVADISNGPILVEETPPVSSPPTTANSPISLLESDEDNGSSPLAPIIIDSSPIKPTNIFNAKPKPQAFNPFFAPRIPMKPPPPSQVPPSPSKSRNWNCPYPDKRTQHIKGPQTALFSTNPPYPPRCSVTDSVTVQPASPTTYNFLAPELHQASVGRTLEASREDSISITKSLDSIPKEHISRHPSIGRVIDRIHSNVDLSHIPCEAWVERWRPRSANEVLGNEASARYLRSWLLALKLQAETRPPSPRNDRSTKANKPNIANRGQKRPRVVTEVARGRGRKRAKTESDDEEDWIVYSDEEEKETDYYASSDFENDPFEAPLPSSPIPMSSLGHEVTQDLGKLHNTILLAGPPGTGKTACVYACAAELGWEVFEVYPGIGRRNGSNIEHLVGDVGKNHLVRQRPQGSHDFFTFSSPSKRRATLNPVTKIGLDKADCGDIGLPVKGNNPQISDGDQQLLAQSVILLEEVDVLFKEDSSFWPTVIKIIKECRRPVICTCNDIALVPLSDLPIQKVLSFEPCSPDITVSYLQGVSCGEGHPVSREGLKQLLESRRSALGDEPESGVTKQVAYDLRHAINLLQVVLSTGTSQLETAAALQDGQTVPGTPSNDRPRKEPADGDLFSLDHNKGQGLVHWETAVYEAETRSFLDSELDRSCSGGPSIEATYAASDDDEMGHTILFETRTQPALPITYQRDVQIRMMVKESLRDMAHGKDNLIGNMESDTESMLAQANKFKSQLAHVLQDVCPLAVWKSPLRHLYVDYAPYIKQIAEADEAGAEATMQRVQDRGGRKTRNSGRAEYSRTLSLSDLGRASLCGLCFVE